MPKKPITRRDLLKILVTTSGGLTAASFLPAKWTKPAMQVAVLPPHAATSVVPPVGEYDLVIFTPDGESDCNDTDTGPYYLYCSGNITAKLTDGEGNVVPGKKIFLDIKSYLESAPGSGSEHQLTKVFVGGTGPNFGADGTPLPLTTDHYLVKKLEGITDADGVATFTGSWRFETDGISSWDSQNQKGTIWWAWASCDDVVVRPISNFFTYFGACYSPF